MAGSVGPWGITDLGQLDEQLPAEAGLVVALPRPSGPFLELFQQPRQEQALQDPGILHQEADNLHRRHTVRPLRTLAMVLRALAHLQLELHIEAHHHMLAVAVLAAVRSLHTQALLRDHRTQLLEEVGIAHRPASDLPAPSWHPLQSRKLAPHILASSSSLLLVHVVREGEETLYRNLVVLDSVGRMGLGLDIGHLAQHIQVGAPPCLGRIVGRERLGFCSFTKVHGVALRFSKGCNLCCGRNTGTGSSLGSGLPSLKGPREHVAVRSRPDINRR